MFDFRTRYNRVNVTCYILQRRCWYVLECTCILCFYFVFESWTKSGRMLQDHVHAWSLNWRLVLSTPDIKQCVSPIQLYTSLNCFVLFQLFQMLRKFTYISNNYVMLYMCFCYRQYDITTAVCLLSVNLQGETHLSKVFHYSTSVFSSQAQQMTDSWL